MLALVVIALGLLVASVGVGMLCVPAGVIVGGLSLVAVGVYLDLSTPDAVANEVVE